MVYGKQCSFYSDPEYFEYLIEYRGNFLDEIEKVPYACGDILTKRFAIVSVKNGFEKQLFLDVPSILFINFRSKFVLNSNLTGYSATSTSGIGAIKANPYLNLTGSGVLIGIADTGIDYLNQEFIREDGTSRIETIWDQTIIDNSSSTDVFIGKTYSSKDINKALEAKRNNQNPYDIVPSKDTNGHGTQLAGIVGARGYNKQVTGIANDCSFVIVKLKESPTFEAELKENNINVPVYNTTEVMAGLEYLYRYSISVNKPIVILLALGSTDYSHDGSNLVAKYINELTNYRGVIFVTGTGNEGISDGHASGEITNIGDISTCELSIEKPQKNLSFRIWVRRPNKMSLNVISPSGQNSKFITAKLEQAENIDYIFEKTTLGLFFYVPENTTGLQVISLFFKDIKPGIWKIQLKGEYITDGRYDIWLSPSMTLPEGTKFLKPDPYTTLTSPSDTLNVVSVAYYNQIDDSIVSSSGKGYPFNNFPKPDIAAPGINIITTDIDNKTKIISGSSVASAITAGCAALILQWGIIDKNDITMFSSKMISYLIAGASHRKIDTYPNPDWGYGKLDLTGVFKALSTRLLLDDTYTEYYLDKLFIRIPKEMEGYINEEVFF